MELRRTNHFPAGLFSYLNAKLKDAELESSVHKKAVSFSGNIKRNISDHLNKKVNAFDVLYAVSG